MGFISRILGGGSSSMSAPQMRTMILAASDTLRSANGKPISLRRLLASAVGGTTTPDSHAVTNLIKEVRSWGGLPKDAEPTSWWESASKSDQLAALSQTAEALK